MKVLLFGKNSKDIRPLLNANNLAEDFDHPDLIVSYGGDGTLLASERKYPGVPKLPIRDSLTCKKCSRHTSEFLIESLVDNRLKLSKLNKLEAKINSKVFTALNDIVIRNHTPIHAIRFRLYLNNKLIKPDLVIGDGIVASTPFGSTGYYKSITRTTFNSGWSVAFNNTTEAVKPLFLSESDQVKIAVIRGPAELSFDNNPELEKIGKGDAVAIELSKQVAKIYEPSILRCQDCTIRRDLRLTNNE